MPKTAHKFKVIILSLFLIIGLGLFVFLQIKSSRAADSPISLTQSISNQTQTSGEINVAVNNIGSRDINLYQIWWLFSGKDEFGQDMQLKESQVQLEYLPSTTDWEIDITKTTALIEGEEEQIIAPAGSKILIHAVKKGSFLADGAIGKIKYILLDPQIKKLEVTTSKATMAEGSGSARQSVEVTKPTVLIISVPELKVDLKVNGANQIVEVNYNERMVVSWVSTFDNNCTVSGSPVPLEAGGLWSELGTKITLPSGSATAYARDSNLGYVKTLEFKIDCVDSVTNYSDSAVIFVNVKTTTSPPVITESWPPQIAKVNDLATWGLIVSDPDGVHLDYVLNWGDGLTIKDKSDVTPIGASLEKTFTHIYTKTGKYQLTLAITDSQSLSTTKTAEVTVTADLPDLSAIKFEVKNNKRAGNVVWSGDPLTITVAWKNNSKVPLTNFDYSLIGFTSGLASQFSAGQIAAGATLEKTHNLEWLRTGSGTMTVNFEVDSGHQISESNEQNNILNQSLLVINNVLPIDGKRYLAPSAVARKSIKISRPISQFESDLMTMEYNFLTRIDTVLAIQVKGKILLQVEANGEAWYVDPVSQNKFYLRNGQAAFDIMRAFGLGITTSDLEKIPIGWQERIYNLKDSDSDGLADSLEKILGTDSNKKDTDTDGYDDRTEVTSGYRPTGAGKYAYDSKLIERLTGRILLQVQAKGAAWYINPVDRKRYYLGDPETAYQAMRFLGVGITNSNLRQIQVGQFVSGD